MENAFAFVDSFVFLRGAISSKSDILFFRIFEISKQSINYYAYGNNFFHMKKNWEFRYLKFIGCIFLGCFAY